MSTINKYFYRVFLIFILLLFMFSISSEVLARPVDASIMPSCYNREGWSAWYSLGFVPNETRTVYFSPMRFGTHYIEFQTKTVSSNYKVLPRWINGTSSGTWGPYTRFGTSPLQIRLSTGSSSVKYQFEVSNLLKLYTRIYVRTYCAPLP